MKEMRLIVDYYKSRELSGGVQSVLEQIRQLDPRNSRLISLTDAEKALGFDVVRPPPPSLRRTLFMRATDLARKLISRTTPFSPLIRELVMQATMERPPWLPFESTASLAIDSYLKAYEELFGPQLIIRNSLVGNLIPLQSKQICFINDNNVSGPELLFRRGYYDLGEFFTTRYGAVSLQLLSARSASACVAPSSLVAKEMSKYGLKVHVIPHGIDTDFFRPLEKEALKREYGLLGKTVACWVGSTHPIKGLDYVWRLARDFPEITFILVFKDPTLLRSGQNVRIMGPCLPAKLRELYNIADFYISTSVYESFGLCPMEAAACNTPVVSLRTGVFSDLKTDEVGCVVDEWNIMEYRHAVRRMLRGHDNFRPRRFVQRELNLKKWRMQWRRLISGVDRAE